MVDGIKVSLFRKAGMENGFLTTDEAATYLGISKSSLYKLNHYEMIKRYKPNNGKVYYRKKDLDAFVLRKPFKSVEQIDNEAIQYMLKSKF